MTELLHLEWLNEADLFALRQRGREIAASLALDAQDQVRLATALSEVGREVLGHGTVSVHFTVEVERRCLVVTVTSRRRVDGGRVAASTGLAAARRLLDAVSLQDTAAGSVVTLTKNLPRTAWLDDVSLAQVRARLAALAPATPLDELRAQNADLVHTLDQLAARQQDLVRINEELEETNTGVLAMYSQLSQELEETNRGVVALYAELDEKGQLLAQANEAKTRFLRNVSHELRTPVNSILGLADLLQDGSLEDEQRVQVRYLHGSAEALLALVNELLDLARAESGREQVRLTETNLSLLFGELRGTMRPVAEQRGLTLDIPDPDVPVLRTDPELLTRVLRNLLTNALKFTETGCVRMQAARRESGQHVEISVIDTGIGIAPEDQERVFEEFFQVPHRLQQAGAGTGLGLAYARRVTESLGGVLELSSRPGVGSTFTVALPAPLPDDEPDLDATIVGHVLLVDDDAAFRHIIRGLLQGVADRVGEAADGEAALAAARAVPPDVILLDLRMPRMDGATMLSALREEPSLRDIPVVLVTSAEIDAQLRPTLGSVSAVVAKGHLTRRRLISTIQQIVQGPPAGGVG